MTDLQLMGLLLTVIPLVLVVIGLCVSRKHRRGGIVLAAAGLLLWAAAVAPFVGLIAFERIDVGPNAASCPRPISDSSYATSHWSWFPPGAVCEFPSGDVGPTYWRVPAALALVLTPTLAFLVMWPRRFVRSPDGTGLEVRA